MSSSALVLGRTPAGKEALLKDLQAAYLDNQVNSWKMLDNFNDSTNKVEDSNKIEYIIM